MSSSIAWTYEFIEPAAQTALRRLGVFRGDFEIDAATAVVAGPGFDAHAAAVAIRQLLDQHLVAHDPSSTRFVMSTEIRAFAHEMLIGGDDLQATVSRHGEWYAVVAERFGAGGSDMPNSMLAPDLADLVSALDASMAGPDPTVAYRIIRGIGGRLAALGHLEHLVTAATWLTMRSPSDGEDRWAAAIACLAAALHGQPDHPIHTFVPEALAIAELGRDDETATLLRAVGERTPPATDATVPDDVASQTAGDED